LPLGSWLKIDPWDDSVHMLDAKRYAPMNPRDKMPFEVTPVFYKLQRYETAHTETPPAPPTAPAATEQPASTGQDNAQPVGKPAVSDANPPAQATQNAAAAQGQQ
jgi:hypothetical protein